MDTDAVKQTYGKAGTYTQSSAPISNPNVSTKPVSGTPAPTVVTYRDSKGNIVSQTTGAPGQSVQQVQAQAKTEYVSNYRAIQNGTPLVDSKGRTYTIDTQGNKVYTLVPAGTPGTQLPSIKPPTPQQAQAYQQAHPEEFVGSKVNEQALARALSEPTQSMRIPFMQIGATSSPNIPQVMQAINTPATQRTPEQNQMISGAAATSINYTNQMNNNTNLRTIFDINKSTNLNASANQKTFVTNDSVKLNASANQKTFVTNDSVKLNASANQELTLQQLRGMSNPNAVNDVLSASWKAGQDAISNPVKTGSPQLDYLSSLVYPGGAYVSEFLSEAGGQIGRESALGITEVLKTATKKPFNQVPDFVTYSFDLKKNFTPSQLKQNLAIGYQTGRTVPIVAPYFLGPELAIPRAIIDISKARTVEEVVLPAAMTAGIVVGLTAGVKLAEYVPLALEEYKAGGFLSSVNATAVQSARLTKQLVSIAEYAPYATKTIAPLVVEGYGAYSLSEAVPYLYSGEPTISREAERSLGVSLAGGYFGGMTGGYFGTETSKMINPEIARMTIVQGKSGVGELTLAEQGEVNKIFKRLYSGELPKDIGFLTPIRSPNFMNLEILQKFNSAQQRFIIQQELEVRALYKDQLYLAGSLDILPQLSGVKSLSKGYSGDADFFLGPRGYLETLETRLNSLEAQELGIGAELSSKLKENGGGDYHLALFKDGINLHAPENGKLQFINLHTNLTRTRMQFSKFGTPFSSTKGEFVFTSEGDLRVLNIRTQGRAKIEGYFFGGRANDIVDLRDILKGTDVAAKAYKDYKQSNVFLDERAMFAPPERVVRKGDFVESNLDNLINKNSSGYGEVASPFENYVVPKLSNVVGVKGYGYETPSQGKYEKALFDSYESGYPLNEKYGVQYPSQYPKPKKYTTPMIDVYPKPSVPNYPQPIVTNYPKIAPQEYPNPYPVEYPELVPYPKIVPTTYPKPPTYQQPLFNPPKQYDYPKKQDEEKKLKKFLKGFQGYVRKGGKFMKVSNAILPEGLAYREAANVARSTLAQSITVREAGLTDIQDSLSANLQDFRQKAFKSKIREEPVYIQKNPLSSKTEVRQIQQAKADKHLRRMGLK